MIVEFWSGNPRNNLMVTFFFDMHCMIVTILFGIATRLGKIFLTVERKDYNKWRVVHTDASWETKYIYTVADRGQ